MAKKPQKNLFQKLTALFKNGPVINKKIKRIDTTIAMPDKTKSSGALLFQKSMSPTYSSITSNAYNLSERLTRYQDFCLTGDTLVALSNVSGAMRIDELVARWVVGDRDFWTFSYDEKTKSIVSSKVTGAVCNGRRSIVSVVLDDGSVIKCTPDHRFLLQDRSYVEAQNLRSGTALMRFSRADFATPYRYVQTKTRGWKPEHVLVAEAVAGRLCTSNEHVHHRNFVHRDNSPSNLEIMSSHDHMSLHAKINNLRFSDPVQRVHMSDVMKSRWSESGDLRVNLSKTIEKTRESRRSNRIAYNKVVKPGKFNAGRKDQIGIQNANADKLLTYQAICDAYQQNDTLVSLANKLAVSTYKVRNRLLWEGYQDFGAFSSTYQNHKVVSVIDNGEFEDVYDIEVKEYNNFALAKYDEKLGAQGIVFVHNCEMEYTAEIAAALDIYADETCSQDGKGRILHIYSDNEKIRENLEELFYNVVNVEFNLRPWTRNLVKYGDMFLYSDMHPEHGVINVFPIPVNEIEREENFDKNDPLAVRFRWVSLGNRTLENWEILHFRLLGNDMFLPYGSSLIEPARRIWRQLVLIEDAMLVYRIVRAPERRAFYIDVGNLDAKEVPLYMEEQKKNLRTNQVVDRTTGRVDIRYNPFSVDEDYFLPVRGGDSGTKIDTLAGGQNTAAVEDVAYIQKKLFAALKIPRAYLGYDESLSSKATLAQEDIRFSRTISAIQRVILSELNKLAIMHLYACGYDGDELQNFTLRLSNPSTIAQQQKLELWRTKFEIAGSVPEGVLSREFIRREILELTEKESADIDRARLKEKYVDQAIESGDEGADDEGADLEDLGGDIDLGGGGGGGDEEDAGAAEEELPPEENASEEPEEEDREIELIMSSDDIDADDIDIKFSTKNVEAPVNVKRHLDNVLYNRSRRRTHGASKTHMPDLGKMSSLKGDDTFEDPFDHGWLKSVVSNPFAESVESSEQKRRSSVGIPPDIVKALLRFRESRKEQSFKQSLLHEEVVQELINDSEDE